MRPALCLLLALVAYAPAQHPLADLVEKTIDATVTRVSDGDTIDILPSGETRPIRVRVFGIDAPERGEPFSNLARNRTRVLVFDKAVRITGTAVDTYGRLVARVRIGDVDLGENLLRAGLACHYTRFSDDRVYAEAQTGAQSRGAGFWAPGASKPRCVSRSSPAAPAAPDAQRQSPVAAGFIGNARSRVFHAPSCRNAGCKNCTRRFATREAAIAAGFRPAGDCLR